MNVNKGLMRVTLTLPPPVQQVALRFLQEPGARYIKTAEEEGRCSRLVAVVPAVLLGRAVTGAPARLTRRFCHVTAGLLTGSGSVGSSRG